MKRAVIAAVCLVVAGAGCASSHGHGAVDLGAGHHDAGSGPLAAASLSTQPAPGRDAFDGLGATGLALNLEERALLDKNHFVISDRHRFASFAEGWTSIFRGDLPLYVTADALLNAVHHSIDTIVRDVERQVLSKQLDEWLTGMRERLRGAEGAAFAVHARTDSDLYLSVALSLLRGEPVDRVAGGDRGDLLACLYAATEAKGVGTIALFGSPRTIDWSRFEPRGHYEGDEGPRGLSRYFRALIWLARVDARVAVFELGKPRLQRRELDLAFALRALMGPREMALWSAMEGWQDGFVGERDAMGPADVDRLLRDLGVTEVRSLSHVPDKVLLDAIVAKGYGRTRVHDDMWIHGEEPPRSFSMTGERYVLDSRVLEALPKPPEFPPNTLDVAYAVLRDDRAKTLLPSELRPPGFSRALERVRAEIDSRDPAFWQSSVFAVWLDALGGLSPASGVSLPSFATSESWERRMLSSQLASWAELRHDDLLYAKGANAGSEPICSYPDAYVDPYPVFYERLQRLAAKGQEVLGALDFSAAPGLCERAATFFRNLSAAASTLGRIADDQRSEQALSPEDLEFVNRAVALDPPLHGGCRPLPPPVHGWYIDLFYDGSPLEFEPTIADIYTQPTAMGPVGAILHVATGHPRLLVVNVPRGGRSTAFVGLVSTYAEITTHDSKRYTDRAWKSEIGAQNPEDVPWMRDLVVR